VQNFADIDTKKGIWDFIAGLLDLVMVYWKEQYEEFVKLISGRRLGPARAQTWEVVLNLQNGVSMLVGLAISVFLLFLAPEL
jgi:hypothetical protein